MEELQFQKLLTDVESIAKSLETIASQMTAANEMKAKRQHSGSNHQFDRKKFNKPFKPSYNSKK